MGSPRNPTFGEHVDLIRLSEMAWRATMRQVDALIAVGDALVVHLEFQTAGERDFAWRMLEYRALLARRDEIAGKELTQHVIVLGSDRITPGLADKQVTYGFEVHYVQDEHVDRFLGDPALAPFAALADVPDRQRPAVLRAALTITTAIPDPRLQQVLTRAAVDLAKIRLDPATIKTTLEELAMPVPSAIEEIARLYKPDHYAETIAALLRYRFGPDDRIPGIAKRLGTTEPDLYIPLIEEAASLDELAGAD
jgi:hypothetical protein